MKPSVLRARVSRLQPADSSFSSREEVEASEETSKYQTVQKHPIIKGVVGTLESRALTEGKPQR